MTKKEFKHLIDCYEMYVMFRHDYRTFHDETDEQSSNYWLSRYKYWLSAYNVCAPRTIHYIVECSNRQVIRCLHRCI